MENKEKNQTTSEIRKKQIKDILDDDIDNIEKLQEIHEMFRVSEIINKRENELLKYKLNTAQLETKNLMHRFEFLELSNKALQIQNEILLTYKPNKSLFKRIFNLD